jgi:hypothetical protein
MRIAIAALMALMLSGLAGAAHAQPPGYTGSTPPPPGPYRRGCRELSVEYHRLRDRYYHEADPGARDRLIHRMRDIDVEAARERCPPTH